MSMEYLQVHLNAMAANLYHMTSSVRESMKMVLLSGSETGFEHLCSFNSFDETKVAYNVALYLVKRVLPAENKDNSNAASLAQTTCEELKGDHLGHGGHR